MKTIALTSEPGNAVLVVLEEGTIQSYSLEEKQQWSMGRKAPGNSPDIVLLSAIAGRKHGNFLCMDGNWFFVDGGSINGTYYNGQKVERSTDDSVRPVPLRNGDVLRIDSSDLSQPDKRGVWMLFTTDPIGKQWINYPLDKHSDTYIGRDEECCQIVWEQPYISRKHAKITYMNGSYYISDCKSLAGTWVNGQRIEGSRILLEKDKISICDCHFLFTGNSIIYNKREDAIITRRDYKENVQQAPVVLQADITTKKVPDNSGHGMKELIRDVHLEVREGSLVALLGSSGAGKTTVMNCLNGMDTKGMEGKVSFYGEDLTENFNRLKFLIGSVPQEEVFHPMLTVEEELKEAAIIRLPADTKRKEIKMHVNNTIQQLGLDAVRKSKIHKCSGGEKKRVNIAIELVADRKLLCLDEPDAGLDPGMKKELFTILSRLAHEEGKSILVIIHDVSDIEMFDQIIMMAKVDNVGRLSFSGTPQECKEYFGTDIKEAYSLLSKNPEKYVKGR